MSSPMPSVTLFFPMYNERESIGPMTEKALWVLDSICDDFEILIVDDGSTDGSERVAEELAARHPCLRVVRHERNMGYGQALRTGFASANKEIIAYTDCDEPAELWLLPAALMQICGADMVIGYRLNRWEGLRRFVYSIAYNTMVRILFQVRARDINFSFKLIRRDALRKLNLSAGSVFIDGELLAEAVRNGLTIYQLPVAYQERKHGSSHFNSYKAALDTLREIWAYWWRRSRLEANRKISHGIHRV